MSEHALREDHVQPLADRRLGRLTNDGAIREAGHRVAASQRRGGSERAQAVSQAVERGPMALEPRAQRPMAAIDQVRGALARGIEVRRGTRERSTLGG